MADPLGLDFWIGMPESELSRVTPLRPDPRLPATPDDVENADMTTVNWLATWNRGGYERPDERNSPIALRAELGATGGITNGRSVARLYAPPSLGGTFDGIRLVSPETILRMNAVQSAISAELTLGLSARFTLGFTKVAWDNGLPESAFGHAGVGGSIGFSDPDERLSFGYVMNQMNSTPRWPPLAKAAYQALGYREGKFGLWIK